LERGISLNALCVRLLGLGIDSGGNSEVDALEEYASWWSVARRHVEANAEQFLGAVLFGSASRGELRVDSDIDLLLVVAPQVSLHRDLYRQWDDFLAGNTLPHEVNAHFVHLPDTVEAAGSLWLEAATEGRLLTDRTGVVQRFFVRLRRAIAAGEFVRGVIHGQPYWRHAA